MPRRNAIVIVIAVLGFVLFVGIGFLKLIAVEKERLEIQKEGIETQRRLHFERRVSEIKSDIEHRQAMLEKKWLNDRRQTVTEGVHKLAPLVGSEKAVNQIGQWLEDLDANYESADAALFIEEGARIAEARRQIWGIGPRCPRDQPEAELDTTGREDAAMGRPIRLSDIPADGTITPEQARAELQRRATLKMNPGASWPRLNAIVKDTTGSPCALIDNTFVYEGYTVQGYRVRKIHADSVEFEKEGKIWVQKVD